MTISYRKIDIYGHPEQRNCPVCSFCKRVSHPSQFILGTVVNIHDDDYWTCSAYCTYALKHGEFRAPQKTHADPVKQKKKKPVEHAEAHVTPLDEPKKPLAEDILVKYRAIPGACWADEDE